MNIPKIEDNIPLAPRTLGTPRKNTLLHAIPWMSMTKGQSVFIPGYSTDPKKGNVIRTQNMTYLYGGKWSVRTCAEGGVVGCRVWCVETPKGPGPRPKKKAAVPRLPDDVQTRAPGNPPWRVASPTKQELSALIAELNAKLAAASRP